MANRHSDGSGQTEQHTRRDYVRLGGTALAATALGGVGATTAVAADSDTVDDDGYEGSTQGDDDTTDHNELTNVLLIDGTIDSELAQYKIVVSGRIEQSDSLSSVDDEASPWDQISDRIAGSTATGVVAHAIDGYRYSGELVSIQVNGNVDVTLEEAI